MTAATTVVVCDAAHEVPAISAVSGEVRRDNKGRIKIRTVRCNRPAGHEGPHRRYSMAAVLHEWTEQ